MSASIPMAIPVAVPVVQTRMSPEELKGEVKQFTVQANRLAKQLIADQAPEPYTGPVVIRHHYYHYTPYYSPWFYSRPSVVVIGNGTSHRRDRREDNDAANAALGILATIGAMFAAYAIGLAWARHSDAERELDDTRAFQQKMAGAQVESNDQKMVNDAQAAAGLKERICKRIRNSAAIDLTLRISLAVGLVFIATGAFAICPPLGGLGLSVAMVAGFAMMFKWGCDTTDQANARDAYALQLKLLALPA